MPITSANCPLATDYSSRPGTVTDIRGIIFQSDGRSTIGRIIIRPFEALDRWIVGILPSPHGPTLAMHAGIHIVIDGEHGLRRIRDRRGADLLKLRDYGASVVMRHHMARTNRNEISGAHHGSRGESISVSRGNLLDERETHIKTPYYFANAGAC